jgi:tetratricopeptide (TPR) repeat protein
MITEAVGTEQWFAMGGVILLTIYLISRLVNYWQSDTVYALGQNLQKANQPVPAFQKLQEAVAAMPEEPLYRDELAQNTAVLALAAAQEENATLSSQLANIALKASDTAVADSPNNVVFLKSRARVLYSLSQLDPKVLPMALEAILKAVDLAPTDAKIHYFAGLLLETNDKIPQAIKMLEETRDLKIDYRDARFHLAKLYLKNNQKDLAKQEAEFIINRLGDDEEVKKWLVDNKL